MIHEALLVPEPKKGKPMAADKFRLEMLRTERGRDDDPGAKVMEYKAGQEYLVGRSLYRSFVFDAQPPAAKPAGPKPQVAEVETPAAEPPRLTARYMETKEHGPDEPRRRRR